MNIDANTARLKSDSINYFIRFSIYKFYFTFFSQTVNFFCVNFDARKMLKPLILT
jgi:hypothetical protein